MVCNVCSWYSRRQGRGGGGVVLGNMIGALHNYQGLTDHVEVRGGGVVLGNMIGALHNYQGLTDHVEVTMLYRKGVA